MELRHYHYYRELAPAMQRYALIAAGYSPPADDAPYLEAGIRPGHVGGHSCGRPREDQGANSVHGSRPFPCLGRPPARSGGFPHESSGPPRLPPGTGFLSSETGAPNVP
jgi:hypothetical protein